MKVVCDKPYLAFTPGKEYEVIQRRVYQNIFVGRTLPEYYFHDTPRGSSLQATISACWCVEGRKCKSSQISEFQDFLLLEDDKQNKVLVHESYNGIKMFKSREEIREEQLNSIL